MATKKKNTKPEVARLKQTDNMIRRSVYNNDDGARSAGLEGSILFSPEYIAKMSERELRIFLHDEQAARVGAERQNEILAAQTANYNLAAEDLAAIGLYMRENYGVEIARGDHKGMSLIQILSVYLNRERAASALESREAAAAAERFKSDQYRSERFRAEQFKMAADDASAELQLPIPAYEPRYAVPAPVIIADWNIKESAAPSPVLISTEAPIVKSSWLSRFARWFIGSSN